MSLSINDSVTVDGQGLLLRDIFEMERLDEECSFKPVFRAVVDVSLLRVCNANFVRISIVDSICHVGIPRKSKIACSESGCLKDLIFSLYWGTCGEELLKATVEKHCVVIKVGILYLFTSAIDRSLDYLLS